MWYSHTMKKIQDINALFYSIKMITWLEIKNIMQSEGSQTLTLTNCTVPFISDTEIRELQISKK
jgi:hypothetical protein